MSDALHAEASALKDKIIAMMETRLLEADKTVRIQAWTIRRLERALRKATRKATP